MREWDEAAQKRFNPRAHAGRDRAMATLSFVLSSFNPRAHAGRDLSNKIILLFLHIVSIHAPTRGATYPIFEELERQLFQSTRPRGARLGLAG